MDRESVRTAKELVEKDRAIVREYYLEQHFFTSAASVLKVLSIVACAASSALWLAGGACTASRWAGAASLAAAALLALLGTNALWLADCAPMLCFYTDVVASTAISGCLLTAGVLSLACCDPRRRLDVVHGPLAMLSACLVISSAVVTYVSVVKRWDDARVPEPRPARPSRFELEV